MQFRKRLCEGGTDCKGINLEERNCIKKSSDVGRNYSHQAFCKKKLNQGPFFHLQVVENIVTLLTDFWSDWSSWSNCTKVCGTGSRTRTRTCKNLFTKNESECKHLDHREEVEPCNQQECSLSSSRQLAYILSFRLPHVRPGCTFIY